MGTENFFVSVIIPVYNGAAFLAEAIASVLCQAHRPLEVIIVDDGSTDATAAIAAGFGDAVRYVHQANGGPPVARNTGLKMALGNVIGFLDADDVWVENKLELQLAHLARDPATEIVVGLIQFMRLIEATDAQPTFEIFLEPRVAPQLGTMLFRKTAFDKIGLFDETQRHGDDVDWLLRAWEQGIVTVLHQQVTELYRRHQHNITNQIELDQQFFITAVKKSLDRRRAQGGGTAAALFMPAFLNGLVGRNANNHKNNV
jgi:glycosyltransferase involved in cell wall biosynthesis